MSFVAILSVKCRFFKAMSLVEFYPNRASISLQWRTQEGGPALPPASVLDQTETRRAGNNFYETRPSHPLYQSLDLTAPVSLHVLRKKIDCGPWILGDPGFPSPLHHDQEKRQRENRNQKPMC